MAEIIQFPGRPSFADRYAAFMSLGVPLADKQEHLDSWRAFGERFYEGLGGQEATEKLRDMIDRKRENLLRQLKEIEAI